MKINPNLPGKFEYHQQGIGFDLIDLPLETGFLGGQTPTGKFLINRENPLVWRQSDGTLLMPPDGFPTDGGSVRPIVIQHWIAKDRFRPAFLFHDGIFQTRHLWVKRPGQKWEWVEVSLIDANALLRTMCAHDPQRPGWWKPRIVWTGVAAFGWVPWVLQGRSAKRYTKCDPNEWGERVYGAED
jgi:hypothetical protein